jgi:hypothetical protein
MIMQRLTMCVCFALLFASAAIAGEPWNQPYTGEDATGPHVIALWSFDGPHPAMDNSGNEHAIVFRGQSRVTREGRFGKGIECFNVPAGEDSPEGAMAQKVHADLSPQGAFTIEASFKLKPEAAGTPAIMLIDNKYYNYGKPELPQANTGYAMFFHWSKAAKQWVFYGMFGFGDDSAVVQTEPIDLPAGVWHHLALVYDGAGTAKVYLNGTLIATQQFEGRAAITPSEYRLTIGGRIGSGYIGFPGIIDQIRVCSGALEFEPIQ